MLKTSVKEIEEATSKWKNTLCLWIARITTALSHSMKPSHASGATQDGQVMVERSDRMWSTGEGKGKPFQYSCLKNPMKSMKRQNDRILKEELPRSVSSVEFSRSAMSNSLRPHESQHARPPCPSPSPGVHSDSRLSSP